jgi:hypothetical protein
MNDVAKQDSRPVYMRFPAIALIAVAAFVLVVGLQELANAFPATFGQDACSHYISGAMIHDYVVKGGFSNPLRYLLRYEEHYPLIGIGHWPPFYYGIEALWMMLFSSSQIAVLLLSATVTATTAVLLYLCTGRWAGLVAGLFVCVAYIVSPLTQSETAALMLDGPITLACLAAMLAYARFLDTGGFRAAALFGLLAAIGLLIKGNAGCLALLPVFALLIARRFDLLFKPAFWLPVLIVAILAGPWYYVTWGATAQGFRFGYGLNYASHAALANLKTLSNSVGPLILVVALVSLARVCVTSHQERNGDRRLYYLRVCAASLFCAAFIFQLAIPAALEPRYMLVAIPPLLILAAMEADYWSGWLSRRYGAGLFQTKSTWRVAALAMLMISLVPFALQIPKLRDDGFAAATQWIWHNHPAENPLVLIAADAGGECASIVGLAMQDEHRPSIFVVRGSRLLGGGGYNNGDYRPRFANASAVMAQIDRYKIPLVLFRNSGVQANWTHLRQIQEARKLFPDRWQLVYADRAHPSGIFLFRIAGNEHQKMDEPAIRALNTPNSLKH